MANPLKKILTTKALAGVAILAVLIAAAVVFKPSQERKYVTAVFPRTVSLYPGSDVRILGVTVGEVTEVEPAGTDVNVKLWYDAKHKVPADAKAVVIAPSIVGDRFVQLTPVYRSGEVLEDGAHLALDHTATPLELDEIYQSIDDLTVGLGPDGANKDGALTHLLDATAENFGGQGEQFHRTVANLSRLTTTLDTNKEDLFGAATEIEKFVSALAVNDQTVRQFNDSLASAADVLAGERKDLAAALRNLGVALEQVQTFVAENKDALSKNIKGLNSIAKILVKQRAALDETMRTAPLALANLVHTFNPATGTLDNRTSLLEGLTQANTDPSLVLCSFLAQADKSGALCDLVKQALPRTTPLGTRARSTQVIEVEHIDRSLAGLVEVK